MAHTFLLQILSVPTKLSLLLLCWRDSDKSGEDWPRRHRGGGIKLPSAIAALWNGPDANDLICIQPCTCPGSGLPVQPVPLQHAQGLRTLAPHCVRPTSAVLQGVGTPTRTGSWLLLASNALQLFPAKRRSPSFVRRIGHQYRSANWQKIQRLKILIPAVLKQIRLWLCFAHLSVISVMLP